MSLKLCMIGAVERFWLRFWRGLREPTSTNTAIKALLSPKIVPEDWRVGEALAQAFLAAHRNCTFPWPASRDLRNPVSSPAGTDLVGFVDFDRGGLFAFGEVKTSTQQQWPPSLIYGRHGLKQQMESDVVERSMDGLTATETMRATAPASRS